MKRILAFTLFALIVLLSCSKQNEKPLTISTNSWIGYTPLFYAQEKGYLKKINIHLITNVSLAEAADVYSVGKADMVTTTQHEYYALKKSGHDVIAIILFDRSKGGDMIFSNKNLKDLLSAKKIYAYLEIDSINAEILKEFIEDYHLDKNKIVFINKDQAQIGELEPQRNDTMLVVTYVPYNVSLEKRGFIKVASTKTTRNIIIIDALCTNPTLIRENRERLKKLKYIIDKSIQEIHANKRASYALVKPYLGNLSYDDYVNSLQLIEWINQPSKQLLQRIKSMGYNQKQLIQ